MEVYVGRHLKLCVLHAVSFLLTLKGIFVLTVETNTPILSRLWSTLYELQLGGRGWGGGQAGREKQG